MNLSTQRDDLLREHVISPVCVYISFCGYEHSQEKDSEKYTYFGIGLARALSFM